MTLRPSHAMLLILALAPVVARADAGYYEINQDCAVVGCFPGDAAGFPVTISQGGHYRLTSDLNMVDVNPAAHGVDISTLTGAAVDLDLGGFSIDGVARCTGNPVTSCLFSANGGTTGILANTPAVVRVHNGTVLGMQTAGILFNGFAEGSSIENMTVTECNAAGDPFGALVLNAGSIATVKDVRIVRNFSNGMFSSVAALLVGATIANNAGVGLNVSNNVTVRESAFTNNSGFGITSGFSIALGATSFFENNGGSNNAQYSITNLRDMGGNVCGDGTCP